MTDDEFRKDVERRLTRLENLSTSNRQAKDYERIAAAGKMYSSWLQLDPAEALINLLALDNHGKEQALKHWGYDGARAIVALAHPLDQADLIARGNFSPEFYRDCAFARNPESIPRYFRVHSAPKRGWIRSPVVVSHKAALALHAAGLHVRFSRRNNVDRFGGVSGPAKETIFLPPSWQEGEWIFFTERQVACLQEYDPQFVEAVADKGLRIEVMTPDECRAEALRRDEVREPGPVLVDLPDVPEPEDPWIAINAGRAARHKVGA